VSVNACASVQRSGPATQERSWRTYLGSARRSPGDGDSVAADPQPVWRADLGRGIAGAPALTEGLVAVAQVDRQVALLDRATGEVIWRRRLSNPPGGGPLVDGDRVFVATQELGGRVHALRLRNGKGVWSEPVGDVAAPLALDDTLVVAATTTGVVAAFGVSEGHRVWRTRVPGAVRTAPVPVRGGIVVASGSDSLFLIDRVTGGVRLRVGLRGSAVAAVAVTDSCLVVGTSSGALVAFEPTGLGPLWETSLGDGVVGTVAIWRGAAYALTHGGALWRVPLDRPSAATRVETGVVARAGPAPTASGVFLSAVNGELTLVDPVTGARRWSVHLKAPLHQPVVLDAHFFLASSARGELVAFR